MFKRCGMLIIAVLALLMLPACGSEESENDYYGAEVHVLTALVPGWETITGPLLRASGLLNRQLAETGQGVRLELSTYFTDIDMVITRMEVRKMAGDPYDLFYVHRGFHNLRRYAEGGFLADIFALIDESPNSSREDFFTNVLDAFAIDGRLYAFSPTIVLHHIAINNFVPQHFIDRFAAKESVSESELMAMFIELRENYPEFSHLLVACGAADLSPWFLLSRTINDFIDTGNRRANLTDDNFVSFLANLSRVQMLQGFSDGSSTSSWFGNQHIRYVSANQYMFKSDSAGFDALFAFFEPETSFFSHHIPLTNDHGELIINPRHAASNVYAITAGGQEALAWELLWNLARIKAARNDEFFTFYTPILRTQFEAYYTRAFANTTLTRVIKTYGVGMDDDTAREEAIQAAINRIATLSEMPIASQHTVPFTLLEDDLDQLTAGLITPETAAQRMHNRVTLWLIE